MKKGVFLSIVAGIMGFSMSAALAADNSDATTATSATNASAPATSDAAPSKMLPMSQVIKNLRDKNYVIIRAINLENGMYHAMVFDMKGNKAMVTVNPQTGVVMVAAVKAPKLSLDEAVQKAEAAGYHDFSKVVVDKDEIEFVAMDKANKKVKVEMDAKSGEMKQK